MLDKLYKRLLTIFTLGMIAILSTSMGIILAVQKRSEQAAEYIGFQRATTFLIYDLENADTLEETHFVTSKQETLAFVIKNTSGKTIYQTPFSFSTATEDLAAILYGQVLYQSSDAYAGKESTMPNTLSEQLKVIQDTSRHTHSTIDYGITEIQGKNSDQYLGIPAIVVAKNNTIYHLAVFEKDKTMTEFLREKAVFYLSLWTVSLLCILLLSRFVLKKALKPTEDVWKSQKEFIASASHELKSPLAVIVSSAEKIEKLESNNQELTTSATVINEECMRMSKLISDMLLLASSDAKTWSINKRDIHIDTLLISLYEAYEAICREHHILLHLDLSQDFFPVIQSDGERITQILGIFISNALQHGKHTKSIEIQSSVTAKTITFYIVDHGAGIAEEDKPYVFKRFYCADKSHTDKSHFGLGLSIADELSKMLSGKVGFHDTDGGGVTFFLIIPL